MNVSESKTHDLQIFLGRIPGEQPIHYEGIPSLIVAEGAMRSAPNGGTSSNASVNEDVELPMYILVANSDVVEVIRFPIHPRDIVQMIRDLTENEARLQQCISFGAQLFDFIFQRSIRDVFRRSEDKGGKIRITLATAVPELAYVPWELLCDTCPGELPRFLSYQHDVHLVRSLRLFNRAEFASASFGDKDGLRILVVTASPRSLGLIDTLKEQQMLDFILEEKPSLENVRMEVLHDATVQRLRDTLLSFRPHIVHLACHGGYNEKEDLGFVALISPDDPSREDLVNSYRFATLIQEPQTVQLVFVNTCFGAHTASVSAFSGIAQCLHAIGTPDVVALSFYLQDKTAHAIVLNFYRYLLREGDSVEDAVTKVRRHLFMNGYIFPESFGLTMYQGNATLRWRGHAPASEVHQTGAAGFTEFTELFNQKIDQMIWNKVAPEFDRAIDIVNDLSSISAHDLYASLPIFENKRRLAVQVLGHAFRAGINLSVFLGTLQLAKQLAQERSEGQPVTTAFLLKTESESQSYKDTYGVDIGDPFESNLLQLPIKQLLEQAIKVNGEEKAFLITSSDGAVKCAIQTLKSPSIVLSSETSLVDPRWALVAHNTQHSGCAFVVLGSQSRVKILIGGWQIAEYSGGSWRLADLKEMSNAVLSLAQQTKVDNFVLQSVLQKCLIASERRRGLSIVVQRNDKILPCCSPGYRDVSKEPDTFRLKARKVMEIGNSDYLDAVAGDNAVIITSDGITLAYQAPLAMSEKTEVAPIPGTGSRHLSIQKLTKETDAIGFVVSADGPITVFLDGKIMLRSFL